MELAAMLSCERFSDRPVSVCPIIGSLLRAYNDNLEDRRRQDLYRYAAEAVFTRGDFALQRRRAVVAIEWARNRYDASRGALRRIPATPAPDGGPEEIAYYVMGSLGRRRRIRPRPGWWSDEAHVQLLAMVDELVALGDDRIASVPADGERIASVSGDGERIASDAGSPGRSLTGAAALDDIVDALGGELVEQPA